MQLLLCVTVQLNSSPTVAIYTMDALLYAMQVECQGLVQPVSASQTIVAEEAM